MTKIKDWLVDFLTDLGKYVIVIQLLILIFMIDYSSITYIQCSHEYTMSGTLRDVYSIYRLQNDDLLVIIHGSPDGKVGGEDGHLHNVQEEVLLIAVAHDERYAKEGQIYFYSCFSAKQSKGNTVLPIKETVDDMSMIIPAPGGVIVADTNICRNIRCLSNCILKLNSKVFGFGETARVIPRLLNAVVGQYR